MADIVTNTLQIGSNNLVLRDADAQTKIATNTQQIATNTQDISTLKEELDAKGVTPEMFGAVGDGFTSDRVALQNAIDYCISNAVPLYGTPGKTYAITNTLTITNPPHGFHMFFNGAKLLALSGYSLSAWKPMLVVTKTDNQRYAQMNHFENLIIDCNEVCCGLKLDYGYDFQFSELSVMNCKTTAIECAQGGECYFNGVSVKCLHNGGNSTGLLVQSSDYHFTDVIIIDADRAVYNASSSMYTRVHAWNTSGCANTYYFVHNSGYPILVQCHADTYETAYYRETDRPLMLIGCVYYINTPLYDSDAVPAVFKFTNNSAPYSGNIKCVNCIFDGLNTTVDMAYFDHKIQLLNCSKKGTINRFANGTKLTLLNGAKDEGLSINANTIVQDGDYVRYRFILDVSAVDFAGAERGIGRIDTSGFRPSAFTVYPCMLFNDDYSTNAVSGYVTINNNNGVVGVKPSASGTFKKVIAEFALYKPLELYED